jgi:putative salt-induced outer membrane protein
MKGTNMTSSSTSSALCALVVGAGLLLGTRTASAQVANGLATQQKATEGTTDVAAEGFQAAPVDAPEETTDATELKLSAGGLFASGNSRLMAMTGSGRFRARRDANQLSAAAAANYSSTAVTPASHEMTTTVRNFQGMTRYDRFLGEGFAAFLSMSARNDRFQGLDLRLNLDPGLAYYVIDVDKHQAWVELGYDLQYDVRRAGAVRRARAEGAQLDWTEMRHSGRAFLGYLNNLNEAVTFNTGLEYLQGLADTQYWRLNWDLGLTSNISSRFSVATTFSLRYDHAPLPGIKKTDTATAINLVYSLI